MPNKFPNIQTDKSFKDLTTLKIGGPIKFFLEAKDQVELIDAIKIAKSENIPCLVIGDGSNLLVSDEDFDGLVIKNSLSGIEKIEDHLIVQSGTNLQELVAFTIENSLDGMSTMNGIPGSVGGAVYGSAGAYGDNIRDYLQDITFFNSVNLKTISRAEYETGYRDSLFKHHKNYVILQLQFGGFPKSDKLHLVKEAADILEKRASKYPPNTKCPGSFFKNVIAGKVSPEILNKIPPDKIRFGKIPAGYLLEEVGAKGDQLGQIRVASSHANTFMNLGHGTASDFYALAKKYYLKVKTHFGLELEPEVQFVNLPSFSS